MGNAFFVVWRESLEAFQTGTLLVAAIDRLIGVGWLPPLLDPVWDSSWLLDDTRTGGKLTADFTGYRARPALTTLMAWASYWSVVFVAQRKARHG